MKPMEKYHAIYSGKLPVFVNDKISNNYHEEFQGDRRQKNQETEGARGSKYGWC